MYWVESHETDILLSLKWLNTSDFTFPSNINSFDFYNNPLKTVVFWWDAGFETHVCHAGQCSRFPFLLNGTNNTACLIGLTGPKKVSKCNSDGHVSVS